MSVTDNSYALCIGVGKRERDADAMVVTVQDAEYIGTALEVYCKIPAANVTKIIDKAAVKSQIEAELKELARKTAVKKADLVAVYFSGHGAQLADDCYLVANDTSSKDIPGTGIPGKVFSRLLTDIQADKMLIFLDCCHAGGISKTDIPFDKEIVLLHTNRVVLTACHESQVSYLSWPASIFTYALVEGLAGRTMLPGDQGVKIFELAMFVRERVAALSKRIMINPPYQQPQLSVLKESITGNFMVADYPDGEAVPLVFKDNFALYTDQGQTKSIDLSPDLINDPAFRAQFDWIQKANSIVSDGNSGYILQDSNGNTFNINSGLSSGELLALIEKIQEPYKQIPQLLDRLLSNKPEANQPLVDVLVKVNTIKGIDEIDLLIDNADQRNAIEVADKLLVLYDKNSSLLTTDKLRADSIRNGIVNIRRNLKEYRNAQLAGIGDDKDFNKALVLLRELFNELRKLFEHARR